MLYPNLELPILTAILMMSSSKIIDLFNVASLLIAVANDQKQGRFGKYHRSELSEYSVHVPRRKNEIKVGIDMVRLHVRRDSVDGKVFRGFYKLC